MNVTLSQAHLDVVLDALDDAAEYRTVDASCTRCGADMCDDCVADAQKHIRYASLAIRLQKAAGQ